MNYLAHFHLARAHDDWIVGALLGEFVKGPLRGEWPVAWEEGMRLHRYIDGVSDRHDARRRFAEQLPPAYRRYAGIVLDVCCDHLLSLHWDRFHDEPLGAFAQRVYALLARHEASLPAPAARMARRLIDYDVLCIYDDWRTVTSSLQRIGERLSRPNPLPQADAELAAYLPQARTAFFELYPALLAACPPLSSAR